MIQKFIINVEQNTFVFLYLCSGYTTAEVGVSGLETLKLIE